LLVLGVPLLRVIFGHRALGHLYTRILVEPRALAFVLLSRLGVENNPTFTWHLLDLLLRVPDAVFDDKWVKLALRPLDSIPGASIRERIDLCQAVIFKTFGMYKAVAAAAQSPVDHESD